MALLKLFLFSYSCDVDLSDKNNINQVVVLLCRVLLAALIHTTAILCYISTSVGILVKSIPRKHKGHVKPSFKMPYLCGREERRRASSREALPSLHASYR